MKERKYSCLVFPTLFNTLSRSTVFSTNVYVLFHPPTTKPVAGSKTRLYLFPLPITETLNSNNRPRAPVPPTHIRTKDPLTVIQLSQNTSVTILAPEVFLERPTTYQSITNLIPPATADSVGELFPLLLALPFRTIVIANENHRSSRRLPDPPDQGVHMIPSHLFNKGCHTPITLLQTISRLPVRHSRRHNLLTRTNTSTTIYPTNLRSATARETVDHSRGRTIPWNETNPITMSPLPPTTPCPSQFLGPRDLHPFKHRPFLAARSEIGRGFIIISDSALRRT